MKRKPDYTPDDLTETQTRLLLRLSERYGIGVAFSATQARTTVNELQGLARAGYAQKTSTAWTCCGFYLTEKAQPVINANN